MKTIKEIEEEFQIKEQRAVYYERFGFVPNMDELNGFMDARRGVGI